MPCQKTSNTLTSTGILAAALLLSLPGSGPVRAGGGAADAIAAKFAAEAEAEAKKAEEAKKAAGAKAEAERRAAEEAEMLARARAEAIERDELLKRAEETRIETERLTREARELREAEERRRAATAEGTDAAPQAEATRRAAEVAEVEARRKEEEARQKAEAERVAQEAEARRKEEEARAEATRKAEAVRLAAEAEARRKAETERVAQEAEARRKEEEARAEATRKAEAARLAAEAEARRKAETERVAQEAEARRKEEEARAEATRKAEAVRLAAEAEARRKAEAEATELHRQEAARAEEERKRALEASAREEESRRLAEKLRQIREARSQPPIDSAEEPPQSAAVRPAMGLGGEPGQDDRELAAREVPPATGEPPRAVAERLAAETTVSVLLVMEPGNKGIRRGNKSGDPILCLRAGCYVSAGPAQPAKLMSRGAALGPFNTMGRRAGACRGKLTCVFRGVELGMAKAMLQPVDLRILKHDRRQSQLVRADATCALQNNRLGCARLVEGRGWRAWIVPESVAREAGSSGLEAALADLAPRVHDAAYHDRRAR